VVIDFAGDYQIDIKTEGKVEAGKKVNLAIAVSKNAVGKSYKLMLKGVKSNFPEDGVVSSENSLFYNSRRGQASHGGFPDKNIPAGL